MSQSIDERIVDLQFNNKQFETGVEDTLKSLDNLKKGLNLEGAGQSLEGVGESASKLGFNFSALEVMAVTALAKITSAVIDFGIQAGKSMILDPILDGFREYELKMQSVQTIMVNTASAGTTMEDVTKVLDELNDYADQTVYSFSDMTQAMSRLTASGVKLDDSAGAIKGISNLAAAVGADANKANSAFLQLGQSISSGRLQYQDWRSVQTAGLGGPILQNELMAIAVAAGEMDQSLMDAVQNGTASFTELIKSSGSAGPKVVFSTETMLKALNNLAEDPSLLKAATEVKTFTQLMGTLAEQSGSAWAQTWESIIGNKDEAVEVWTSVNNAIESIIGPLHDGRNATMALWKEMGGRDILIEGISNAFKALLNIIEPITKAFVDVFPPITAQRLVELTEDFRDFTASLMINETTSNNIQRTFAGLFAALDLVGMTISTVLKIAGKILGVFLPVGDGVLGITAGLGDFVVGLRNVAKTSDIFGQTLKIAGSIIDGFKSIVTTSISIITDGFEQAIKILEPIINNIKEIIFDFIDGWITTFGDSTFSYDIFNNIATAFSFLATTIKDVISGFSGVDTLADSSKDIQNTFTNIGQGLNIFIDNLKKVGTYIWQIIGPALGYLKDRLSEITFKDVGDVLAGGGIFMIGKAIFDIIKNLKETTKGFNEIIEGITGSLEAFQTKLKADAILKIAIAIGVLAAAILLLAIIDNESLSRGIMALTVVFAELSVSLMLLQKATLTSKGLGMQLISLGIAILVIAVAMKKFSELDEAAMSQGIQGLSSVMMLLLLFTKITGGGGKLQASTTSLVGLAAAVLILSIAVSRFGQMDTSQMIQGLLGIAAAMMAIVIFIKLVGSPERMISLGIGLMALGVSMIVFAGAVALFGVMPLEMMVQGILGLAAALMAIAVATKIMPNGASMVGIGIGLNLMAVALLLISGVVAIFGNMSTETLAKGIGALAAALLVMAAAAKIMTGTLAGAAALLVLAFAINMLVPAIALLGLMSIESIGIALLALAGVFVVLGLSALILTPLAPVILSLAASVLILGVGIYALGAGLVLFAAGLAALALGGATFVAAFTAILVGIISLIPEIASKLAEGLGAFADTLVEVLPGIFEAVKVIFTGLLDILIELVPKIVEGVVILITKLLETLVAHAPAMIDAGMKLIIALLQGISEHIQEIVVVALKLMEEFLRGIAEGIPGVISAAIEIVNNLLITIGQEVPKLVDAAFKMIIEFINGLAEAIRINSPLLIEAFANLSSSMIEGLVGGLMAGFNVVVDTVKNLGNAIIDGFKNVLGINSPSTVMQEAAGNIADGLTGGLDQKTSEALKAGQNLVGAAEQGVTSNASVYGQTGTKYGTDFSMGLANSQTSASTSGKNLTAAAETGLKTNTSIFGQTGIKYGTDFSKNLINTQTSANTSGKTVTIRAEDGIKHNASVYGQTGTKYGTDFSTSLSNTQTDANTSGKNVAIEAEKGIKENVAEFEKAGQFAGAGFIKGLEVYVDQAAEMARKIAKAAKDAIDDELDIESPSKVLFQSGVFSGLGFVNGLASMADKASSAGSKLGSTSVDGIKNAINKITDVVNRDMEYSPTITPVLDLSNIQNGMGSLNRMLSGTTGVTPITTNVNRIASQMSVGSVPTQTTDIAQTSGETKFEFIQNNYSPKTLSRLELYRQTKNQFAQFKEVVNNA